MRYGERAAGEQGDRVVVGAGQNRCKLDTLITPLVSRVTVSGCHCCPGRSECAETLTALLDSRVRVSVPVPVPITLSMPRTERLPAVSRVTVSVPPLPITVSIADTRRWRRLSRVTVSLPEPSRCRSRG